MTAIEGNLLAMVGGALFHALTHIVVHDTKLSIERFFERPERLHNHDVRNAVQASLKTVSRRLQRDYLEAHPGDARAKSVFKAIERHEFAGHDDFDAARPADWLSIAHMTGAAERIADEFCPDRKDELWQFLRDRFPTLFVFAFREIGLKGNQKVRAVIFQSMLDELIDGDRKMQEMLIHSDAVLQSGLQSLGYEMSSMRADVADLLQELRKIKVLVNSGLLGDGPVLAQLRVDDEQGNTLRTEPVRNRKFVIGRGGSDSGIAIHLDDPRVSRRHAAINLDAGSVLVEDLKSTHGTIVDGNRLTSSKTVPFGTAICIGPFRVAVLHKDTLAEELMTDPTRPC